MEKENSKENQQATFESKNQSDFARENVLQDQAASSINKSSKEIKIDHAVKLRDKKTYIVKDDSYLKSHSLGNKSSDKVIEILKSIIPQAFSSNYIASYLIGSDSSDSIRTYDRNISIIAQSLINKARRIALPIESFGSQSLPLFCMVLRFMVDPNDDDSVIISKDTIEDLLSSITEEHLQGSQSHVIDIIASKFDDKAKSELEKFLSNNGVDDALKDITIDRYRLSISTAIGGIIKPLDIKRENNDKTEKYILSLIKTGDLSDLIYGVINNKEISTSKIRELKTKLFDNGYSVELQDNLTSWLNSIETADSGVFFKNIYESMGLNSTKDKGTMQDMMLAIHDMTNLSGEVYRYIGQIHTLCDVSFESIEKIAALFENTCRLISTSRDLEVGQAYFDNFLNNRLFSHSIVSHLFNISSFGAQKTNDQEDITIREDLRNKLVSIINRYTSSDVARISVNGMSTIANDMATIYSPIDTNVEIDFYYTPSLEISDSGNVLSVNKSLSTNVIQDSSNGKLSFGLSVKDLFSLRCIRLSGDDKFFKAASGNFKSAEFISHIQFPVFIKDVLMNKLRTMAFIIESLLSLKQQALYDVLEVQMLAISDIGSALYTTSHLDAISNYSMLYNDTVSKAKKYMDDLINRGKLNSKYSFELLQNHIPLFNLYYDRNSTSTQLMTIDGLSDSFSKIYKSLLSVAARYHFVDSSVHDDNREPYIAYKHESVLSSRKLKVLDFVISEFFRVAPNHSSGIIPDSYYQNIIKSDNIVRGSNLYLSNDGLEYYVSIMVNRGADAGSSKRNLFVKSDPISLGSDILSNHIPSDGLIDLANSLWSEYFNTVSYDKTKLFENVRKIESSFGPYIIPLMKLASSPFDGISLGFTTERFDLNLGAKFIYNSELLLSKVLGLVGLNEYMIINFNEYEAIKRLISAQSHSSNFPLIMAGDWEPGVSLADILDINPSWAGHGSESSSNEEFFEVRHIYLRSDDLIEMMLSDSILIKYNYQVQIIRYNKSPLMLNNDSETNYLFLDIHAKNSCENFFLFNDFDIDRITKHVVTELREGVMNILGYNELKTRLSNSESVNSQKIFTREDNNANKQSDILSRLREKLGKSSS